MELFSTEGGLRVDLSKTEGLFSKMSTQSARSLAWRTRGDRWRSLSGWSTVNRLRGLLTGLEDLVFTVLVDRIEGVRLVLIMVVDDGSND